MRVPVPSRRSTIIDGPEGLEIVVPAKRNPSVILFLSAWLVGWAMGEFFAGRQVFTGGLKSGGLFLIAWLAMWTVGGGWAIYSWLWLLVGREVIRLRPGILAIKRDVFATGRTREYDVQHVRNLRVSPHTMESSARSGGLSPWGTSGGSIAFDYGSSDRAA